MPPANRGFGPQIMSGPFAHLQQSHIQHHSGHTSASNSLPPPSLAHPGFAPNNINSNPNPFTLAAGNNALATGLSGGGLNGGGGGSGLASHAAQMGFAHGAALQQQQAHELGRMSTDGRGNAKGRIRDVWRGNLASEMHALRGLVEKYPYISMDTEFPGIVARPMGQFTTKAEYHYQTLRCNVDLLKMIQLGITLFNSEGESPPPHSPESSRMNGATYMNNLMPCPCTWQFNFRFSLSEDMFAQDSIVMLQKAGLDFDMHEKNGIDPLEFGALLMTSGLVLLDDVHWISFHSGYDFGYLMKIMLCKPLPEEEADFRKLLGIFFPAIYDIKYLMKQASRYQAVNNSPLTPSAAQIINNLGQKSGLQDIADELSVKRLGIAHTAGSDSWVTGKIFWEVRRLVFNGVIDDDKYLGQIWGLNGVGIPASGQQPGGNAATSQAQSTPNLNGATIYTNGGPSTPNVGNVGLASTPGQNHPGNGGNASGLGPLTPGGGGGVFGGFQFGKG